MIREPIEDVRIPIKFEIRLPVNLGEQMNALQTLYLLAALWAYDGNITRASAALHVSSRSVRLWLRELERRLARMEAAGISRISRT